jgi:hypothetical protein
MTLLNIPELNWHVFSGQVTKSPRLEAVSIWAAVLSKSAHTGIGFITGDLIVRIICQKMA